MTPPFYAANCKFKDKEMLSREDFIKSNPTATSECLDDTLNDIASLENEVDEHLEDYKVVSSGIDVLSTALEQLSGASSLNVISHALLWEKVSSATSGMGMVSEEIPSLESADPLNLSVESIKSKLEAARKVGAKVLEKIVKAIKKLRAVIKVRFSKAIAYARKTFNKARYEEEEKLLRESLADQDNSIVVELSPKAYNRMYLDAPHTLKDHAATIYTLSEQNKAAFEKTIKLVDAKISDIMDSNEFSDDDIVALLEEINKPFFDFVGSGIRIGNESYSPKHAKVGDREEIFGFKPVKHYPDEDKGVSMECNRGDVDFISDGRKNFLKNQELIRGKLLDEAEKLLDRIAEETDNVYKTRAAAVASGVDVEDVYRKADALRKMMSSLSTPFLWAANRLDEAALTVFTIHSHLK